MLVKISKLSINVILIIVLIWSIVNFSGYILLKELIKNNYINDIVVEKLSLNKEYIYELDSDLSIHWNPLSFGLDINNLSFADKEKKYLYINVANGILKFNIFTLINGNFMPKAIIIDGMNFNLNNDYKLINNSTNKKKIYEMIDSIQKIKNLKIMNANLDIKNKNIHFNSLDIKNKKKSANLKFDIVSNYFGRYSGKLSIDFKEQNNILFNVKQLKVEINQKNDIKKDIPLNFNSINADLLANGKIFFNEDLSINNINGNFEKLNGDLKFEKNFIFNDGHSDFEFNIDKSSLLVKNLTLFSDKNNIKSNLSYFFNKDEKKISGEIKLNRANLENFLSFWPNKILETAKIWYKKNIKSGIASDIICNFNLIFNKNKFINEKSSVNLSAKIDNANLNCCENQISKIEKVKGDIKINLNNLISNIHNAQINDKIDMNNGAIQMNFQTKQLLIEGEVKSKVKDLIDTYKENFKINILGDNIVEKITGDLNGNFKFNFDINKKKISQESFLIKSKNLMTIMPKNRINLGNGDLNMKIDNNSVSFNIDSTINNSSKSKIEGKVNLSTKSGIYEVNIEKVSYSSVKNIINDALKDIIKIDGLISGKILVSQNSDQKNKIEFFINLKDAILKAPYIKLDKGYNIPAEVRFNVLTNNNDIKINDLRFFTDGKEISFDSLDYYNQKKHVLVKDLKFNAKNLINYMDVDLKNGSKAIKINADSISYNDFNWLGFTDQDNKKKSNERILIDGKVNNLIFSENKGFKNLNFEISCEEADCQRIAIRNDEEKNYINGSLTDKKIEIFTDNAGLFLSGVNITDYIHGGKLNLDGYIVQYGEDKTKNSIQATAKIDNFTIKKAPIMAKILSFASLGGLLTILTGQGVHFNHLVTNFVFFQNNVIFGKSIVDGESMGIIFNGDVFVGQNPSMDISGSLTPMNFINILIRKVPILGNLLVGTSGNGIFTANFRLHGSVNKPKVAVNPVNILTPYVIKQIFGKYPKKIYG